MSATGEIGAARRYASALFNVTQPAGSVDTVAASLNEVADAMESTPQLLSALHNPRLPRERKHALMTQLFSGKIHSDVLRLLFLMVDNDRTDSIVGAAREYSALADEHRGVTDAEVMSAVPLSPQQENALIEKLQQISGRQIRLKKGIDENLLGGLVVRLGDHLIDASVATKLEGIREKLKQAKVV